MSIKQIIALSILGFIFISSGIFFSKTDMSILLASVITTTLNPAEICLNSLNKAQGTTLTLGNTNITPARLNDDTTTDYIVEKNIPQFCGSTGCIFELCIVEKGKGRIVPFGFSAEKLTVLETLTSGMHDIQLQGKSTTKFIWENKRYTVN